MLPDGLDPMYRAALASSHQPYLLVEILDGNRNVLLSNPTYLAGSVSANLNSRVARTCQITFDESFYPYGPDDLLAPYGNMIRATRGIEFADGSRFDWVVFLGRIQFTDLGSDGTCTANAADLAADVIEAKFLVPENSQAGTLVTAEVVRLITDAVPLATFGASDNFTTPVQPLTWQLDRGQALDELGASVGAFWYPLANGDFVLRRYAWTVPSPPVVTLADGDGGVITDSTASRARESVYNSLTVTGERLNGDVPVYATAQDINPTSPTFINGTFGRRHQMLRLQTPASQSAAQGAAQDNLRRLTALVDTWSWDMVPDAALELGDTVSLNVRGRSDIIQVVSGFTLPLDLSGPMRVQARAQVINALEGV
jgi:hypothetical protein